jgi:8-oxo-dGTP pyrophosphatase MutT (NUDIX family)
VVVDACATILGDGLRPLSGGALGRRSTMTFCGTTDKLAGYCHVAHRHTGGGLAHRDARRTLRRMSSPSQSRSGDPTHAGGVVFREQGDRVEYLLVRSTGPLREWVLPKGHIEADESTHEAAVREVDEEASVRAAIVADLDTVEYTLRGNPVRVQFYLMKALPDDQPRGAAGMPKQENRECAWLPLEQAQQRLTHAAYRRLLALADGKRPAS